MSDTEVKSVIVKCLIEKLDTYLDAESLDAFKESLANAVNDVDWETIFAKKSLPKPVVKKASPQSNPEASTSSNKAVRPYNAFVKYKMDIVRRTKKGSHAEVLKEWGRLSPEKKKSWTPNSEVDEEPVGEGEEPVAESEE
jgi:hypothetical protein